MRNVHTKYSPSRQYAGFQRRNIFFDKPRLNGNATLAHIFLPGGKSTTFHWAGDVGIREICFSANIATLTSTPRRNIFPNINRFTLSKIDGLTCFVGNGITRFIRHRPNIPPLAKETFPATEHIKFTCSKFVRNHRFLIYPYSNTISPFPGGTSQSLPIF